MADAPVTQPQVDSPLANGGAPADAAPAPTPAAPAAPAAPAQPMSDNEVATGVPDGAQTQLPAHNRWLGVVKGALQHLEGAAQGLAVAGAPGAVAGAVNPAGPKKVLANAEAERKADLAKTQSTTQWQNVQAAEGMAREAMYRAQVQQMPQQFQETLKKDDEKTVNNLIAAGFRPITTTVKDSGEELDAAKEDIKQHGGVPGIFHFGDGFAVFDIRQLSDGPMLDQTRQMLKITRPGAPLTSQEWNNALQWPKKVKDKTTQDSLHFFDPTDPKELERYQGMLNTVQKTWPDDDPDKQDVVKKLTNAVSNLQGMRTGALNEKLTLAKQAARERGMAINEEKIIMATNPDTGVEGPIKAKDAINRGWIGPQQFNKVESEYIKPAVDAELSYQKFLDAFKEYKAGAKTGAPSMQGLAQHLATTFGGVKGNRVTKDMIEQHLGARSVSDKVLVATQKLSNGDVLSPDQWDAFRSMITASRRLAWGNAASQAAGIGVDIRARMPKDLGGRAGDVNNPAAAAIPQPSTNTPASTPTPNTHVFSASAWLKANPKGNVEAAKAAAKKANYQVVD